MTFLDLIQAFARELPVAVCVTDAQVETPGPTILYANEAFGRLTGRDVPGLIGLSPRFMQGRETRRPVLDRFAQALRAGKRFHGHLVNYRADGTRYVNEIDCRPIQDSDGQVAYFLAFEREVVRRRGRPWADGSGRYEPREPSNTPLTEPLRNLSVFALEI